MQKQEDVTELVECVKLYPVCSSRLWTDTSFVMELGFAVCEAVVLLITGIVHHIRTCRSKFKNKQGVNFVKNAERKKFYENTSSIMMIKAECYKDRTTCWNKCFLIEQDKKSGIRQQKWWLYYMYIKGQCWRLKTRSRSNVISEQGCSKFVKNLSKFV